MDTRAVDEIEILAAFAHSQWSGWMRYLFSKCTSNSDGTMTIPMVSVSRWTRQLNTDYADLTEIEKESDRKEAREMIKLFNKTRKKMYKVPFRSIYCDNFISWLRAIAWCFLVLKIWPNADSEAC